MKKMTLLVVLCFAGQAFALDFEVIGPCDEKPRLETSVEIQDKTNLGDVTVKVLNDNKIAFKGDAAGIAQIEDSPVGRDAVEMLSSTEFRAYGWCVHIDNTEPAEMPDQVEVNSSTKKVTWFYAYSLFDGSDWTDYCTPSWKVRSLDICKSQKAK